MSPITTVDVSLYRRPLVGNDAAFLLAKEDKFGSQEPPIRPGSVLRGTHREGNDLMLCSYHSDFYQSVPTDQAGSVWEQRLVPLMFDIPDDPTGRLAVRRDPAGGTPLVGLVLGLDGTILAVQVLHPERSGEPDPMVWPTGAQVYWPVGEVVGVTAMTAQPLSTLDMAVFDADGAVADRLVVAADNLGVSSYDTPVHPGDVLYVTTDSGDEDTLTCGYHKDFYQPLPTYTNGLVWKNRTLALYERLAGLEAGDLLVARTGAGLYYGVVDEVAFADRQVVVRQAHPGSVWRVSDDPERLDLSTLVEWRYARLASRPAVRLAEQRTQSAEQRHAEDIAAIGAALGQEARRRGWCEELEQFLDRLNGSLHLPLDSGRRRERTVRATFTVTQEVEIVDKGLMVRATVRAECAWEGPVLSISDDNATEKVDEDFLRECGPDWEWNGYSSDDADIDDEEEVSSAFDADEWEIHALDVTVVS